MNHKLKGCRALEVVRQDFTNTCIEYGAIQYRAHTLSKQSDKLRSRLDELDLEIKEATRQEAEIQKQTTNLQAVGDELQGLETVQ